MKVAICTTTINVPDMLKLHLAEVHDSSVRIFVACDKKTPTDWGDLKSPALWPIFPDEQAPWKCSPLIPWNCIQRRNIAFLEALNWGADVIISLDDDNLPLWPGFADVMSSDFMPGAPHSGLEVSGSDDWFDVGRLLIPRARHRGFPMQKEGEGIVGPVTGVKIGVVAGSAMGDPDVDAITRIVAKPEVHQISELLNAGVTVHPHTWTVFNSQNTAIAREFLPAWFMFPFVGRMDDIYASLVVQRVMRERGHRVHFGHPLVWQQRNEHNLIKDLRAEIDGYEAVARIAELLDRTQLAGRSVIDDVRRIYDVLELTQDFPAESIKAGRAWLEDCGEVLGG